MKYLCLVLALALGACVHPAPAPAPPLIEPPAEPPPPPSPPPLSKPVAKLADQYHATAAKEGAAITRPDVTADYVRSVHEADTRARQAIAKLDLRHGHRPTTQQLAAAKAALGHLQDVLYGPSTAPAPDASADAAPDIGPAGP